ncbi:dTDP-4-dehydrorhamnose reductase family protein [Paraburkholderia kururiensis]|uniref:dTDP-4-dehydrorhamnose reductase n=1 Tax=Paraburkholderia kururiensis TaxID=984307 RepID=A0ABZ0WTT9_9BURK|nr:SDR family oxidoreductase [Paraburkholderia kururiensis]WQD80626.1 SDR family oxidoreductase [Paraburkholderia kururiensis]
MFKVGLLGASGLLGRAIAARLRQRAEHAPHVATEPWQVVEAAFRRAAPGQLSLDIRDAHAVERFMEREAPQAIVIAAAERRPDICERDPALARALNVEAVAAIARAAKRRGAWVLSISTDYVFDGTRPPYRADAPPSPINAYGRSKLEGEHALLDATDLGLVLRLPLLYGPIVDWQESAVTSLVPAIAASARSTSASERGDRAQAVKPAVMDAWAIRYPTFTPDVAYVVGQLLERLADGQPLCGIAQWSGNEPMTKYEIAQRLAAALEMDVALVPQTTPADATPRPYNCHLDSSRLEALGIGRRTPFDTGIRDVLRAFPWRPGDAPQVAS